MEVDFEPAADYIPGHPELNSAIDEINREVTTNCKIQVIPVEYFADRIEPSVRCGIIKDGKFCRNYIDIMGVVDPRLFIGPASHYVYFTKIPRKPLGLRLTQIDFGDWKQAWK